MNRELTEEIPNEQEHQTAEKVSRWYYADLTVSLAAVIGIGAIGLFLIYPFSAKLVFLAPAAAIFIGAAVFTYKRKYRVQLPKSRRIAAGCVRGVLYSAAAVAVAVPSILLFGNSPAFYGIQREIFGAMYTDRGECFLRFIPEEIPKNTENYSIYIRPGVMRAACPVFEVSFSASQEQLEEYRKIARANGGALISTGERLNRFTDVYEPHELWTFRTLSFGLQYAIYPSGYFTAEASLN